MNIDCHRTAAFFGLFLKGNNIKNQKCVTNYYQNKELLLSSKGIVSTPTKLTITFLACADRKILFKLNV